VPRIHFGVGTSELLELMGAAGAEVIGVDWRLPLAEASGRVGHRYALQGNLDPALLSAPWPVLSERVREVITSGAVPPGHIFNLGHGVPPDADPAVLARIVELVHTEGPQLRRTAGEQLAASAADGR
jgi:uroporphyrinogen decarboxylase